jgi:outer membrane receptor protein involved in Fe transport
MQINKNSPLSLRRNLLMLAVAAVVSGGVGSVKAQEDKSDEGKALETVVVTGSRIAREGFITPSPVTAITAEEIRATGALTVSDLLNSLPALQNTFSLGNSSRFIGTVGLGLLDLRGLGTARTLVLVNGRRHVGASPGSSAVDVNTIPVEWIERVEVITGGASAVYGADAVAGVVNFILKKKFDGFEVRGQHGQASEGGFDRSFVSFTGGKSFADDRGTAAFSIEYSNQDRFVLSDREIGRRFQVSIPNPSFDATRPPSQDNPQRVFTGPGGNRTSSYGGRFLVGGVAYLFDPNGSFRRQRLDGVVDGTTCVNCDFLDLNGVADLQPALNRFSINTMFNFDLDDNNRFYFEGKYTSNKSDFLGQPSFDSLGNLAGTSGGLQILLTNPLVSPELRQLHQAAGLDRVRIARFNVDAGQRGEEVERQTTRVAMGLEGDFGDSWSYDVSAVYGQTTADRVNLANRINERFQAGLDVTRTAAGALACRTTVDPTAINPHTGLVYSTLARTGCVPFSIFGDGAISEEASNWFNARGLNEAKLTQSVFSASVSNPALFETWAGSAGFAAGAEYRKETSVENTDPLAALGLTFLNAIPSENGDYAVKEVYTEFSLPLLSQLPGVELLTFDVAGRYSDYNTIGSTGTWRVGLDWTIIPSLRARGTLAQSVRAPGIGELFGPQSQNFATINDPCESRTNRGNSIANSGNPTLRAANCAALGVPVGFQDNFSANRPGLSGGNPDLLEEEGRTTSLGMVWQPEFVAGLGLSIDWWKIHLTDAIGAVTAQTNANRCVDAPGGIDNPFCRSIVRAGPTGFVDSSGRTFGPYEIFTWTALNENLSRLEREGVDLEADYKFELFGGNANLRFLGTKLLKVRTFAFQDFPNEFTEALTTEGSPRWRANLTASYKHGGWRGSWDMRHVDGMLRVALESFQTNPGQISPIMNGSHTYHDLQLGYTFGESGLDTYLGIDNAFDKDPPIARFGRAAGDSLYDNLGRFVYAGLTYKF